PAHAGRRRRWRAARGSAGAARQPGKRPLRPSRLATDPRWHRTPRFPPWPGSELQPVVYRHGWYVRDSPKPGKALGDHPLRDSILATGELVPREAEQVVWDVIVVGTGMGGGMLGYSLAKSGRTVLFVEKGRSTLPGVPGTIRSSEPEVAEPLA